MRVPLEYYNLTTLKVILYDIYWRKYDRIKGKKSTLTHGKIDPYLGTTSQTHEPNKKRRTMDLTLLEDGDVDTTAVYVNVYINNTLISAILDTGAARTCMAASLATKLNLAIDAPSDSVFTMGNGVKQPALGLIYDVPLNIGGLAIIPGTVEVLPICPSHLIIGTSWLNRAKARINMEKKLVAVSYKTQKAEVPIAYYRRSAQDEAPLIISSVPTMYTSEYSDPNMITGQAKPTSNVYFDDTDTSSEESSTEEDFIENDDISSSEDEDLNVTQLLSITRDSPQINIVTHDNEEEFRYAIHMDSQEDVNIEPRSILSIPLSPYSQFDNIEDYRYRMTFFANYQVNLNRNQDSQIKIKIIDNEEKLLLQIHNDTDDDIMVDHDLFLGEVNAFPLYKDDESCEFYTMNCDDTTTIHQLLSCSINSEDKETSLNELDIDLQSLIDITDTPESIKTRFLILLNKYKHIFDWHNDSIGHSDLMEYDIKLKPDAVPYRAKPYRLSPLESEYLQKEIDKFLRLGIIRKS
ncbi:uncharacterized protein EV154DRAFT_566749 [Mucor mucedo]|uniref:uncharacterized protein n=1 Tax=Mucor mucedo TaxID=29922 RepID=UPI00221F7307|nr:uncharacterized protein EV154DRAFT_566749 [Mucor mucedo]KAI7888062.1 hypothetical protein EV154DRAFT_566749 [Mucor mucedo]